MGLFKSGTAPTDVSQSLTGAGMSGSDASRFAQPTPVYIPQGPASGHPAVLPAMLGAGLAAAAGGGLWGLIVILTGYVIGYMALGIGLLSGFAVVIFSRGQRGLPLQVIAVAGSVLGIVIGKYTSFFHFVKKAMANQHGEAVAANVSLFSEKTIRVFALNIGSMLSAFDILWVFLAVITAWRIPKTISPSQQG